VTVTDCGDRKRERSPNVFFSLSTVVANVQRSADIRSAYKVLSNKLAASGFQNIVLECGEKKGIAKIVGLKLPAHIEEGIPREPPITEKEVNIKEIPLDLEDIVFADAGEVLASVLGVSLPVEKPLAGVAASIPMTEHGLFLIVFSDQLTEEELPSCSAFRDLMGAAMENLKLLEEERRQKEFSERIIKGVQEGIMIEDSQGVITFVNPRLVQMLSYTGQELIGQHYSRIACPEYMKVVKEETKKRPHGVRSQYEACLLRKDSTPVPVIVSASPLFDGADYMGTLTVFTDISAQKKAEKKIRALKEFSENIIQSMHEAIIIENEKGVITFVNPKLEELLEMKKEDIIGHYWQKFTAPEYIPKVEGESARRIHGVSGQYEAALLTRSGRQVPIMVGSTPLFENERFTGVISVCVDLTVVKEKEREIRQMNEDLQLLNKINHALNKGEDLKTILDMSMQEVQSIFDSDIMAIMSIEENGKIFRSETYAISPEVCRVLRIEDGRPLRLPFTEGENLLERAVKEKKSYLVHVGDFEGILKGMLPPEIVAEIQEQTLVKSAVVLPLVVENEVIGIMIMGSNRELDRNDFNRLKSLSKHLALAIDHGRLDETFHKTSLELQAHLREQTLLRELVEKLYMTGTQAEIMDIIADGLKHLGYEFFGIALKEEEEPYVKMVYIRPEDILDKLKKAAKKAVYLDRIRLPEKKFLDKAGGTKRGALVTDNIQLAEEKHVISLPLRDFIQAWVGTDKKLETAVMDVMKLQSLICIPFQVAGAFVGVFAVGSQHELNHHDFVVLETLGQIVSQALGKLQYSEALEKKSQDLEFSNRQLSLLQEITNALNSTTDLGELLRVLVRGISSAFGYTTPSVYLLSEDGKYLLVKEFDITSKLLDGITKLVGFNLDKYKIPLFEGSQLKKVLDEKKPLVTDDIPRFLKDYTEKETLRRLASALYRMGNVNWVAAVPLMAGDEPVGMLVFGSKKKIEQEDIDALGGFLDQAVLAVYKARLYEELAEANKMKSEFIDVVSHELKTPLTAIMLYLEMMEMGRYGELTDEQEEKIGLLQASAKRLQEIIDRTLFISKIRKRKLEIKKVKTSMVELINEVVTQLQPLWDAKKQHIDVQKPYKFPLVEMDKNQIWKVVTALLDNAIKYSADETRITVKLYDREEDVEVAVMDEGAGIRKKEWKNIFKEFYIIQPDTADARMDGRTGMGLFIAKGIVEEHGGKIWVESVYGLGSTFHFTIPK
jgi:PAS domain S-box-containing protein